MAGTREKGAPRGEAGTGVCGGGAGAGVWGARVVEPGQGCVGGPEEGVLAAGQGRGQACSAVCVLKPCPHGALPPWLSYPHSSPLVARGP